MEYEILYNMYYFFRSFILSCVSFSLYTLMNELSIECDLTILLY